MTEKKRGPIINCHTHIFTHAHVPDKYFYGIPLVRWLRFSPLQKGLEKILKYAWPLSGHDRLNRLSAFVHAAFLESQAASFKKLAENYPEDTRFIVLPMDMAFMGAGTMPVDIDAQHATLAELATESGERMIPFAHIDPRRKGALKRLRDLIENKKFKGVKIYPALGYDPDHDLLVNEVYPYLQEKNLPVTAHCSPGIVYNRHEGRDTANAHGHPNKYRKIIADFPRLRICLAHFGGISEWKRHIYQPATKKTTWLSVIIEMMRENRGQNNLYADISYTVFNFQSHVPLLKVLLQDSILVRKILFGSDYYMAYNERYSEKRLSIDLRAALGEKAFWQIANENPMTFLGESTVNSNLQ